MRTQYNTCVALKEWDQQRAARRFPAVGPAQATAQRHYRTRECPALEAAPPRLRDTVRDDCHATAARTLFRWPGQRLRLEQRRARPTGRRARQTPAVRRARRADAPPPHALAGAARGCCLR